MANILKKNFSLIATLAVILIAGVGGYYLLNLKKARYNAADLVAVDYRWGIGDTLINRYNSLSGDYQYLDNRDSLIRNNFKFNGNNVIFLHNKANEIGLWTLPDVIAHSNEDLKSNKVLRYEITFTYEQKTKKIVYMTDYDENPSIRNAAEKLQALVAQTIADAENRTTAH